MEVDAGLDGPAAVHNRQAGFVGARPMVEPLTPQVIVRREVTVRLGRQRCDGSSPSRHHGVILLDVSKAGDGRNGQGIE